MAPFSARSGAVGYASAALADESARGEQWLPLWAQPWTAAELRELLQEGRCQLGTRASEASIDVARAIARLSHSADSQTLNRRCEQRQPLTPVLLAVSP